MPTNMLFAKERDGQSAVPFCVSGFRKILDVFAQSC